MVLDILKIASPYFVLRKLDLGMVLVTGTQILIISRAK